MSFQFSFVTRGKVRATALVEEQRAPSGHAPSSVVDYVLACIVGLPAAYDSALVSVAVAGHQPDGTSNTYTVGSVTVEVRPVTVTE